MIAAIIQARMGSSRLAGKVMMPLPQLGKPVLMHVVNRVQKSSLINLVCVATTTNIEDDIIENICISEGVPVFRGSQDDVLDRYYQCAKLFSIDIIVRITADCPMHDPKVIDYIIQEYCKGRYDYVTNTLEYTFPDGLDVEVFPFQALELAWRRSSLQSEREHVTPYLRTSLEIRSRNVISTKRYPIYRFTLDTPEDYTFIHRVFEGIGAESFSLDQAIEFLDKHPDLLTINQHIPMNEGYCKSLIMDAKHSIIHSERVYLRHLTPDDVSETYCQWLNDEAVNRYLETKNATIDDIRSFLLEKWNSHECLLFGIFRSVSDTHIGNVKLEPINPNTKEATIGILIGDRSMWGKGICSEVINKVVNYAFQVLKLNKIILGVISDNTTAIRCYKKSNFRIEGVEPYTGICNNSNRKKIIMSITNSNHLKHEIK